MIKKNNKLFIKISLISMIFLGLLLGIVNIQNKERKIVKNNHKYIYVNDYIFDNYYPVVNQKEKIIKPFNNKNVVLYKDFYDKDETNDNQKNSLIFSDGIYIQNYGLTYESQEKFDVISSVSGTVRNINDDVLLGKTIEIISNNEILFIYQSLDDILVKKGDVVSQGQKLASSGKNKLNKNKKYILHYEIHKKDIPIDPKKCFDITIDEIIKN